MEMSVTEKMWEALEAAGKASRPLDFMDQQTLFSTGVISRAGIAYPVSVKAVLYDDATLREASTLMTLSHPSITRINDIIRFQADGQEFLAVVEEYYQRTLGKEVKLRAERRQLYTDQEAVRHVKELIDALAFLQERGISHRCIHPDNIFVAERHGRQVMKIGNFWWSLLDCGDSVRSMSLCDYSHFSSPLVLEARRRRESKVTHNSFKSDVYSLGSILRFLVDGIAFSGFATQHSDELRELIADMLQPEERNRPTFLELKEKFPQTRGSQTTEPETPKRQHRVQECEKGKQDKRRGLMSRNTCASCSLF